MKCNTLYLFVKTLLGSVDFFLCDALARGRERDALELAIASCTPFVPFVPLNGLSPVVPRSWLIASCGSLQVGWLGGD